MAGENAVPAAATPAPDSAANPDVKPAAAVPATPAPVPDKAAPAPAAAAGEKPAEGAAPAKKGTLLGDEEAPADGDKTPAEGEKKEEKPDAAAAKVVPEKYEIKVPEGMKVDTSLLEAVTPVFKELGITQEAAQKLADAYAPVMAKAAEAQKQEALKAFDETVENWGKESKEMLGPDYMKAKAPAVKLINTFGGKDAPAIRQLLTDTGLGNHPLMLKFLIAAGKAISQDSFVEGGNQVADNSTEAVKERMYPTMGKK